MLAVRHGSFARVALFGILASLVGCSSCGSIEEPEVPLSTRPSFGELVYRVIKGQLRNSDECPDQYVAELEQHHSDFVTTFDYVIEHGVTDDFPELLGGTIKPFVDNDKLPRLVDSLAATLALLISDEFDPNRDTIQSMVNLAEAQTLLESSVAIQLVSAVLVDDTITDKIHALAVVAQENDGVTYVMDDILDVASYALESDPTPSTCTGLPTPNVQTTLLRTQGFVEDARFALGSPFYLARPDPNGNPRVLNDAGTLRGPFVDTDGDLIADVNADLEQVDASGNVVDLAMIGEDDATGRDAYGRALDAQMRPVYDYYDVKRTALSYTVQIGADLFAANIHHQLPPIIDSVLGVPQTCTDGSNCRVYPSSGHVAADLTWLVFELAEYNRISVLMRTLTQLLTADATKAEQLLVAIGDIVRALDATNIQLTDTSITDALRGLIPLLADVFAAPNAGSQSTARVLVDVLEGLGAQADALPADINYMLLNQYDSGAPNDVESVNLSLARFPVGGDDNRTGLEQLIELFEYADCGYVGPGTIDPTTWLRGTLWGVLNAFDSSIHTGTLAQVFVEILSHQTPATVNSLVGLLDTIQGLLGNNTMAWFIQNATGGGGYTSCSSADSAQTAAHLPALQILAGSGGLDWILPLADTFGDQGQLRLLIDIFGYIAREFRLDEDGNASTSSALRRLMPALVSMTSGPTNATPLNRILDAIDILLTIPASDGNGNSIDVMIDGIAYMTGTRTIQTRPVTGTTPGTTSSSFGVLLLDKIKTMQQLIAQGGAGDELTRLVDGVTPLLTSTTGVGTGRRLANPNLRLLAATYTSVIADATSLSSANYLCYLRDLQSESTQFMTSKHFATSIRVLKHLATSPNAAALEDWIVSLMRGNSDRDLEVYGRVLQLAAGALSSDASSEDLSNILDWLGAGLQVTGAGGVREMVQTLDELLTSDTDHAMLTMMRTVIAPGPLPSMERPLNTFLDTASDVGAVDPANACMATGRALDVVAIEDAVSGVSEFLERDPNDGAATGIEQVWSLVGTIAPAE